MINWRFACMEHKYCNRLLTLRLTACKEVNN